jgi:type VI secretion system secreted protein Hcp
MSNDTFIKFDGVDGESTSQGHAGEIEVLSWSWGIVNASSHGGGGGGTGKAQPSDVSFTHRFDKASPVLEKRCAQGVHLPQAVLSVRKSGAGQADFLKFTLKEVFITSIAPSGGGGEIMETVSLSFAQIEVSYKPQTASGGVGGEVKFGWNVKTSVIT